MKKRAAQWIGCFLVMVALQTTHESVAQPLIEGFDNPLNAEITRISRLTVSQEEDGSTEATVNFSFSYDGRNGPTALIYIVPVSGQYPKSGLWFGSDPFTITRGRGVGSVEISYFQDEPGAPEVITTERFRALIVEDGGRGVISDISFQKTINWGKAGEGKAKKVIENQSLSLGDEEVDEELIRRQQEIEAEKLRLEQERQEAEMEAQRRREIELQARKQAAIQEVARLHTLEIAQRIQEEAKAKEEAARLAKLEEERQAAEAEAARLAKLEEERKAAEAESARLAKLEEERKAAEAESARLAKLEEERKAAEAEAARLAKLEEERKAAEAEAARLAKLEEERKAAEAEAARLAKLEEERKAAEAEAARLAKLEEERKAAEAEAARLAKLEEERKAAEAEAARLAKLEEERKAAQAEAARLAKLEAEQKAAKAEAARLAQLEEERKAAEAEAARLAKLEEERKAARAEAARLARLEEERKAAEAEAARLAKLEEERKAAEAEAARLAKLEEERKAAEAEAARLAILEEERKAAEAEAARLAKLEEERKAAEAEAARLAKLEEERKAAEAEAARLAKLEEERKAAEAETARLAKLEEERKAQEEAARLAKLEADQKAQEAERKKFLELLAVAEAKAAEMQKDLNDSKLKSEQAASEAQKAAAIAKDLESESQKVEDEAKVIAEQTAKEISDTVPMLIQPEPGQFKTKVTHVDVVNRSRDRSSMTIGVEFEMRDQLKEPAMGVRVTRKDEPRAFQLFESDPEPIGRSRRNFLLLPVRFNPSLFPSAELLSQYATDQVQVYLTNDPEFQKKYHLFDTTMLLHWETEANSKVSEIQRINEDYLEIDTFKKNDLYQGYVSIRYRLKSDSSGRIEVSLFQADHPETAEWMDTDTRFIDGDAGLEVLNFAVSPDAAPPQGNLFQLDTILIRLFDSNNNQLAEIKKTTPMTWALVK